MLSRSARNLMLEEVAVTYSHDRRSYIFNRGGKERCNYVSCKKISKLTLIGEYMLCNTHRKHFDDTKTKQYNIITRFLPTWSTNTCDRVGCYSTDVVPSHGGYFCLHHHRELLQIRLFKRVSVSVTHEIQLRTLEQMVRKTTCDRHYKYIQFLATLIK